MKTQPSPPYQTRIAREFAAAVESAHPVSAGHGLAARVSALVVALLLGFLLRLDGLLADFAAGRLALPVPKPAKIRARAARRGVRRSYHRPRAPRRRPVSRAARVARHFFAPEPRLLAPRGQITGCATKWRQKIPW